ncbi:MAG: lipopolysaccharide kinase InaA family protein [Dissulfurimicrobium sp.]|uniref:lipopolysaccharide kinase InaA family protein n=1 Tax=Dissulfurimicrobium sp. TaxID=2022436 RepID=UPI00404A14BB
MKKTFLTEEERRLLINRRLPDGWKRTRSSANAWIASCTDRDGRIYFFKYFIKRSFVEGAKAIFKGTRAYRFVKETMRLKRLGFLVPDVLEHAKDIKTRFNGEGWCLTEGLRGLGVINFWRERLAINERKAFISALAQEIARLHKNRIRHGDLRLSNILVITDTNPPGKNKWNFAFLDNERNRSYFFRLPWTERCRNLVQMNMDAIFLNIRHRLFFLKVYGDAMELDNKNRRCLIRDVAAWTERRIKKRGLKGCFR